MEQEEFLPLKIVYKLPMDVGRAKPKTSFF